MAIQLIYQDVLEQKDFSHISLKTPEYSPKINSSRARSQYNYLSNIYPRNTKKPSVNIQEFISTNKTEKPVAQKGCPKTKNFFI